MKKTFLLFAFLLSLSTISADTYFEIDDYQFSRADIGTMVPLPVKAHFSGRLSAWQIYFTLPEGLTLRAAESTEQMKIYYYNRRGKLDSITPGVSKGTIPTVLSVIMTSGFWDPDGDGEYETYGVVKWEAGDYDHFFTLWFDVLPEFKGGEMIMETNPASGDDTRGGTIKETGDHGKKFFTSTMFTLEPPMPGDVDGNGSLSIADATLLVDYLLNQEVEGFLVEAADVDGNDTVSIPDVTALIDLLVNQ